MYALLKSLYALLKVVYKALLKGDLGLFIVLRRAFGLFC